MKKVRALRTSERMNIAGSDQSGEPSGSQGIRKASGGQHSTPRQSLKLAQPTSEVSGSMQEDGTKGQRSEFEDQEEDELQDPTLQQGEGQQSDLPESEVELPGTQTQEREGSDIDPVIQAQFEGDEKYDAGVPEDEPEDGYGEEDQLEGQSHGQQDEGQIEGHSQGQQDEDQLEDQYQGQQDEGQIEGQYQGQQYEGQLEEEAEDYDYESYTESGRKKKRAR